MTPTIGAPVVFTRDIHVDTETDTYTLPEGYTGQVGHYLNGGTLVIVDVSHPVLDHVVVGAEDIRQVVLG